MNRVIVSISLLALCLAPSAAQAQAKHTPGMALAAGYSGARNLQIDRPFPAGIFLSFEGTYSSWIGVAGEFSGVFATRTPRFLGDPQAGCGAFLAGPRFLHRLPGMTAFAEVLGGIAGSGSGEQTHFTAIGIQAGAGLDVRVHRHVAIRLSVDRRQLFGIGNASGMTPTEADVRAGVVLF